MESYIYIYIYINIGTKLTKFEEIFQKAMWFLKFEAGSTLPSVVQEPSKEPAKEPGFLELNSGGVAGWIFLQVLLMAQILHFYVIHPRCLQEF